MLMYNNMFSCSIYDDTLDTTRDKNFRVLDPNTTQLGP